MKGLPLPFYFMERDRFMFHGTWTTLLTADGTTDFVPNTLEIVPKALPPAIEIE